MAGTVLAGQRLLSSVLGVPPWSAMTLSNSWSNTGGTSVTAQYRLWLQLNEVEVIGVITAGTLTNGTTIATLPNTPATTQPIAVTVQNSSGSASADTPRISVNSLGQLQIFNIPSGTTIISFHGWYSLDA